MLKEAILIILRSYRRYLSPILPSACRYYPTCSQYAIEAVEGHGAGKGLALSIKRLLSCHPWGKEQRSCK